MNEKKINAGLGITPEEAIELFNNAIREPMLVKILSDGRVYEHYQKTMNQETFIFALGKAGLLKFDTPKT